MMLQRFLPTLALALSLLCSHADAQKVWVVKKQSGPGIDFTNLQQAADAAADGDTILVGFGSYGALVVGGKGLNIIADNVQKPHIHRVTFRNQAAGQTSTLIGFLIKPGYSVPQAPGIKINNCQGGVWIENCDMAGAVNRSWHWTQVQSKMPLGFAGLHVLDSNLVTVLNTTATGGFGEDGCCGYQPAFGAPGIRLEDSSNIVIQGCTVSGGKGGSGDWDGDPDPGGDGGAAVRINNSSVTISSCQLSGGIAGYGGVDLNSSGPDGHGGDGIYCVPATSQSAQIQTANLSIRPGFVSLASGHVKVGKPLNTFDATMTDFALPATDLTLSTPVRVGDDVHIKSTAPPGFLKLITLSGAPTWQSQTPITGFQVIDLAAPFVMPLAGLPDQFSITANTPLPAGTQLTLFAQLVTFDPVNSELTLGDAASVTLLDAAL